MGIKQLCAGLAVAFSMASVAHADTITLEYKDGKHPLLPDYIFKCKAVAYEKIASQAKAYGVAVDMRTLRITEVDSSSVVAKYLWWSVDVTNINGRTDVFPTGEPAVLTKLTQQPPFSACF